MLQNKQPLHNGITYNITQLITLHECMLREKYKEVIFYYVEIVHCNYSDRYKTNQM